jgi:hypothetical protein
MSSQSNTNSSARSMNGLVTFSTAAGVDIEGDTIYTGYLEATGIITSNLTSTNITTTNLTASGTLSLPSNSISDSYLSNNVDFLNANQTISGIKTFSSAPIISQITRDPRGI